MENEIKNVNQQVQEILKQHKLMFGHQIDFPMYKILPDEVKLALAVLSRHEMKIGIVLKPIIEEKQEQ